MSDAPIPELDRSISQRPRLLHISKTQQTPCFESHLFRDQLSSFGELTLLRDGSELTAKQIAAYVRQHDVYLAGWNSVFLPASLALNPGRLKYVCGITGTMREYVPIELIDAGIPLTNWGDAPANGVAEGAMVLLLSAIKSLRARIDWTRGGGYADVPAAMDGTLAGLNIGIYGCGAIGRRFVELLRPFGPIIRIFDPLMTEVPIGCIAVESLPALISLSEAIVIHAASTEATRRSITADLLSRLPDNGIIVNTARGDIIDQAALFEELESGRLRAALDVLDPDELDAAHPARQWDNLILTCHTIARSGRRPADSPILLPMERHCLENLRRFVSREPLRFVMDRSRFARST